MEAREQKGLEIAAKSKLQQTGDGRWFVPLKRAVTRLRKSSQTPQRHCTVQISSAVSFAANTSLQSNT